MWSEAFACAVTSQVFCGDNNEVRHAVESCQREAFSRLPLLQKIDPVKRLLQQRRLRCDVLMYGNTSCVDKVFRPLRCCSMPTVAGYEVQCSEAYEITDSDTRTNPIPIS